MAEVGPSLGIAGPDLGGAAKMSGRLFEAPQLSERRAQIVMCLGMIRKDRQRPPIAGLGFCEPPRLQAEIAELILGLQECRVERDRFAKRRLGISPTTEHAEHEAVAVAAIGPVRSERYGALDKGEGGGRIAGAQRDEAAQMPGAEMGVVAGDDLPAGRLGILRASRRLLGIGAVE
jgi:hypothetical protein